MIPWDQEEEKVDGEVPLVVMRAEYALALLAAAPDGVREVQVQTLAAANFRAKTTSSELDQ